MPVRKECGCNSSGNRVVMACSGRSNVGQLANEAAKEIGRRGGAEFLCLAAVAARIDTVTQKAKAADQLLVIDGCDAACGRKILDAAGLTSFTQIDLTTLGIEKRPAPDFSAEQLETAIAAARSPLGLCGGAQ